MTRPVIKISSIVLAIFTILSLVSMGLLSAFAATATVVTTDAVRLRSSAAITDSNIITTLSVNEELTLLSDSSGGWAHVKRQDGTKGYCSVDYLNSGSSSVKITGVTTDDVNFRTSPTTDDDNLIRMLSSGETFDVLDNSNESWVKVSCAGKTGYIYRYYTELSVKIVDSFTPDPAPGTPDWFDGSLLIDMVGSSDVDELTPLENTIALSHETLSVEAGKTATLSVHISGGNSIESAVTYISSDSSVLTVSSNGTLRGVKEGDALVTATISGTNISDTCKVTVTKSTSAPVEEELVLSETSLKLPLGNHAQLKANLSVSWKSSDTSVVTVSGGILTAKSKGTATVTASTKQQTKTCTITVTESSTAVTIEKSSASVTVGKTYYNGANSSKDLEWSSSDTSVAIVENGFITGLSKGTAVITVSNSLGAKTCLVTVKDAEPIRFAYTEPNTAGVGETITLYAVTDVHRTAVKFEVTVGNKVVTVNATNKVSDSGTFVWSGTTTISSSGTFKVVAYSKEGNGEFKTCSSSCDDAKTDIFIRTTKDVLTESLEKRRGSDAAIKLISEFEGYSPCVYFDTIANNIPTIGYGKVIHIGETFYNDMTKKEAYAYLVKTVNEGGYTSQLNSYFANINVKFNQRHFDALLSFSYNLGAYILSSDGDFKKIFTASGNQNTTASETDAYIDGDDVNFRKSPSTSSEIIGVFYSGDKLKLLKTTPTDNWYYVENEDGLKGYVYADYVKKGVVTTDKDYALSRINKDDFIDLLLQYHHAGPTCVRGLLNRRVDELDVFFYGDYKRDGSSNKYRFKFTCPVNSNTKL